MDNRETLRRRLRIQRRRAPRAATHPLAELLALFGGHLLPAFVHSLADSLAYSPLHSPTRIAMPTATKAKSSKQNPAKGQQSNSLPKADLPQSEQRRRQPVPQKHHDSAAERGEDQDPKDRQWNQQNYFRQSRHFRQSLVHVSLPRFLVVP